jgi:tripartite-type tricarboxylate transporter receptor subunit TctC
MRAFALLAAATLALCATAQAQSDYPNKPVRMINDSAAGSATDTAARLTAERLSAVWGQQVIVENKPGAGGSLAVRAASEAPPDGYTLYVGAASTFTALKGAPGVAPNLPIELPRDFAPIGFMTQQPMFIAVSPKLGISTLAEFIELAKKKPGGLSYATTGRGRITHLTMELIQMRAGIQLQMIPYTGGPHASSADVSTGRVDAVLEGYSGLAGAMTSGIIKGIAVSSPKRLDDFKDLPAVSETLPGFVAGGWNVLLAPVGTPEAIIRKASADLRKALDDANLKAKLGTLGAYLNPMTPEQVIAFAQEQQRTWRPVGEKIAKEMAAPK